MAWALNLIALGWRCARCQTPVANNGEGSGRCECASTYGIEPIDRATDKAPVVGDCFYRPDMVSGVRAAHLSPQYRTRHATTRAPITVVLPDSHGVSWWCVDELAYDHKKGGYHGEGWMVEGDPPLLTCTPSINVVGRYHGYVKKGVITDDCEGRVFPNHPATA